MFPTEIKRPAKFVEIIEWRYWLLLDHFTDTYYWRLSNWTNWEDGRAACQLLDHGDIVSIHDFNELDIVIRLGDATEIGGFIWIGLNCPIKNCTQYNCQLGEMIWVDGASFDYYRWGSGRSPTDNVANTLHGIIPYVTKVAAPLAQVKPTSIPPPTMTGSLIMHFTPFASWIIQAAPWK